MLAFLVSIWGTGLSCSAALHLSRLFFSELANLFVASDDIPILEHMLDVYERRAGRGKTYDRRGDDGNG